MLDTSIYAALGIGSILGSIVSVGYNIQSKAAANALTKDATGLTVPKFINYTMLGALSGLFVIFATLSFMVRDFTYPKEHLLTFILETVSLSLIVASLYLISAYIRTGEITNKIYKIFALLFVKFMIAHLLLQFSGYYTYVFST